MRGSAGEGGTSQKSVENQCSRLLRVICCNLMNCHHL